MNNANMNVTDLISFWVWKTWAPSQAQRKAREDMSDWLILALASGLVLAAVAAARFSTGRYSGLSSDELGAELSVQLNEVLLETWTISHLACDAVVEAHSKSTALHPLQGDA